MHEINCIPAVLVIILAPFLGSFLLPLVGMVSPLARNIFALIQISTSFILTMFLIPIVSAPKAVGHLDLTLSIPTTIGTTWLHVDGLALFMAMVSSLVGAVIVLYSFGYISHYENQNEYYFMVLLFLGSMMGLVFSANLLLLFVFWEITAITSWRLIGFYRDRDIVEKSDSAVRQWGHQLMTRFPL